MITLFVIAVLLVQNTVTGSFVPAATIVRDTESVYATQTLGSFVIDEINGVVCDTCETFGQISAPALSCSGKLDANMNSCTKQAVSSGTILGAVNAWPVDYYIVSYISLLSSPASISTLAYDFNTGSAVQHVQNTIQYDGADDSFCIKGADGITGGLGGIDLSQGGTQNAIVLQSSIQDSEVTYDITIYDTQGNSERSIMVVPQRFIGVSSLNPYEFLTDNVFNILYTIVPFTNMSIFSDVDAIEMKFYDNPGSYFGSLIDYSIGGFFPRNITTAFVDGCRFVERFNSPELTSIREAFSPCFEDPGEFSGFSIPTHHNEFRTCFKGSISSPGIHEFSMEGPLVYSQHTWMDLPYGNTFSIDDLTDYISVAATTVPGITAAKWQYDGFSPGIFGSLSGVPNGGGIVGAIVGSGVLTPPFPLTGWGLIELDFANQQPGDGLFRTVDVRVLYKAVFVNPCVGTTISFMGTPLDVNMLPLSAPIPFVLTGPGGPGIYTGSFTYDAGSNILRGVRLDMGSISCPAATPPFGTFVLEFAIQGFTVTADGYCHRPVKKKACRHLQGFVFDDLNDNGVFDDGIDAYPDQGRLIRIQSQTPGALEDYSTLSGFNGTFWTECYEIGEVLEIFVEPVPGDRNTTENNPQLYTVTADCENIIPAVGFTDRYGVAFKIYNDVNNNGMYDMGEPGFVDIEFKTTKLDAPFQGEMRFGTSDAFGNVIIEGLAEGNHTLDLIDTTAAPLFGYTQTEGMDPINITVTMPVMNTTTVIENFGYHRPAPMCAMSGPMRLFVDHFDGPNTTSLTTSIPNESLVLTEMLGTGLGGERNVQLTAVTPMWMSFYSTVNASTSAFFMVYEDTLASLFLQWDGADGTIARDNTTGLGGVDLTQDGNATAICVKFNRLCGDYRATLVVGNSTHSETQVVIIPDASMMPAKATFFFIDPLLYADVTFVELTLEAINPNNMAHVAIIDYVSSECAQCEQSVTFEEADWDTNLTTSTPFQQLADYTKIMPYAHFVQFDQTSHSVTEVGTNALVTANLGDTLTIDFDFNSTDTPLRSLRRITLDALIIDQGNPTTPCNGVEPMGPTVRVFDTNNVQIYTTIVLSTFTDIGDGVFSQTAAFDANTNRIRRIEIDYSTVVCTDASPLLVGIDNLMMLADGPCGGAIDIPITPVEEPREFLWQPIALIGPLVVIALITCCCCWCFAADKRRRKRKPRRYKQRNSRTAAVYKRI